VLYLPRLRSLADITVRFEQSDGVRGSFLSGNEIVSSATKLRVTVRCMTRSIQQGRAAGTRRWKFQVDIRPERAHTHVGCRPEVTRTNGGTLHGHSTNEQREAQFYGLPRAGRKHLTAETNQWHKLVAAIPSCP
jgi:hypothetical protein